MTTGRNNTIGQRYQIIEQIGAGGMGTVFRAYDLEIEREVALKWLPAYFSSEMTFVERFKREARVIARLEHPHIVPIYDVGEHEGRPFIIMRLLSGGTLRDRIGRADFTLAGLVKAMEQIGDALTTAHAQQIVHRDLKPGNILFDEHGSAFLSDFGIAKVLDSATQLTGSGLIGTPAYMSPEQFIGQSIDGRSDQYSLAVVIFEVLAGRLPFEGNTAQMMYKHLNVEPPDIDLAQKPLPTALNLALHKALSKNPESRYATIAEFVGTLRTAITADPEAARFVLPPIPDRRTPSHKTPLTAPTEVDTPSPQLMDRLRRDYRTGLEAMNRSDWTMAVAAFDRVLSADPSYGDALQLRAQAQTRVTAAQAAAAPPPAPPDIEKTSLEAPVGAVPLDVTQIETPSVIPAQPQPHRKREAAPDAAVAAAVAATAAAPAATAAAPAVTHPPKPAPVQPKATGLPTWTKLAGAVAAVLLLVLAGFFALRGLGGDGDEPPGEAGPAVAGAVVTPTTAPAEEAASGAPATEATGAGAAGADATGAGAAGAGSGAGGADAGGPAVVAPTNTPEPTATAEPSPTPEPPTAEPAAAPPTVRVTVSSANLRTGPGTIYSIAGVIRQGDQVKVLATNRDGTWYNVELPDGSRAWIAKNITEPVEGANLQALPVAATIPAPPTATRPAAQPTSPPQQPPTSPPQQPPTSPPQQPPTSPPPTSPPPPPPTEPPPPPPATYTPVPIYP